MGMCPEGIKAFRALRFKQSFETAGITFSIAKITNTIRSAATISGVVFLPHFARKEVSPATL